MKRHAATMEIEAPRWVWVFDPDDWRHVEVRGPDRGPAHVRWHRQQAWLSARGEWARNRGIEVSRLGRGVNGDVLEQYHSELGDS